MGLAWIFGIIFVVLKLTGFIDWSWWFVVSPFVVGVVTYGIAAYLCSLGQRKRR